MRRIFNGLMQAIGTVVGLVMMLLGGVWILQGLDLAFRVGFMVGDRQWVLWGALLALAGLGLAAWSNKRARRYKQK